MKSVQQWLLVHPELFVADADGSVVAIGKVPQQIRLQLVVLRVVVDFANDQVIGAGNRPAQLHLINYPRVTG